MVRTNRKSSRTSYSSTRGSTPICSAVDWVVRARGGPVRGASPSDWGRNFAARQRRERFAEGSLLIKRDRAGRLPSKPL